MRNMLFLTAILGVLASVPAVSAATTGQDLIVAVNEARALPLSQAAAGVAVGNPLVAAVTVQSDRLIFLTGKAIGATNIVVVDGAGRTILERTVMVTPNDTSSLTLQRGSVTIVHECTPVCAAIDTGK